MNRVFVLLKLELRILLRRQTITMFGNPNWYLVLRDRENPIKRIRGTATGYAEIKILDGLKYRISGNGDVGNVSQEKWVPSWVSGAMFSAPPNPAYGSYYTYNYYT